MTRNQVTREELFALMWERPATRVAEDLGISDVALGKLCRRLQVPKPPRAYWARIKAGQTLRRPPLLAFREDGGRMVGGRRKTGEPGALTLSPKQREYVQKALDELSNAGIETGNVQLLHDSIRRLNPQLAGRILILAQKRYR